jgi:hypothetical protein
MCCQRDLRELKKADALTLISQMETRPQHRRLVAGTRPATTLSPVAYISTDFIGCAIINDVLMTLQSTAQNGYYHVDTPLPFNTA